MNRKSTILGTILLLLIILLPTGNIRAQGKKQKSKEKPFTLVIDPGHGGVDPGAPGRFSKEKDINLKVSKLFGEKVKEAYPEVKIIYTRTTDVQIPLVKRATIANDANADLFISIHSNASKNRSPHGCETFTLGAGSSAEAKAAAMYENEVILSEENFEEIYKGFNLNSSENFIISELIRTKDMEMSAELAQLVQNGMVKSSKLYNRGVSSAGFLVLHKTVMPKILIELGFISNREEEKFLASKQGQEKLATGIFNGFSEYYKLYGKPKSSNGSEKSTKASTKESSRSTAKAEAKKESKKSTAKSGKPLFKIQILATDKRLGKNDKRLKGVNAEYYKEGGLYKYTYGASEDYNAIQKTRKEISKKFPQAFIIAFIDGEKVNTNEAIKIFKEQK